MFDYEQPMQSSQQQNYDPENLFQKQQKLTKQVNQIHYEAPSSKYNNPWHYAPEFLKVFSDARVYEGEAVVFDAVLLGSPRPKVVWLFNDRKLPFRDVQIKDTADICQLTIPRVRQEHFGHFTLLAENELGTATASARLIRSSY